MADPMPKIKAVELGTIARRALALPARILFPPVCAGCRRHVS
ncbi:ComF family protein, partial [Mesorhizobium sp. M2D.F.Ca.ET.178.01.1.1]